MKILVAIKQVPYVDQLKFDRESRRLVREGVESEINPFDKRALTWAINFKNRTIGVEVVALTMGPPQAKEALVEALAMGADRAVHLLGREFAGADTLATARAIALACRKLGFDLILCGKYSTDAETAQVPPMLAELLDVPQVTSATTLEVSADGKNLSATRELDDGTILVEAPLPAVVSAAERLVKPIKVAPADLEKGRAKPIEVLAATDLSEQTSQFGLNGSPTWVSEIYSIEPARKHILRTLGVNPEGIVQEMVNDLVKDGLFDREQAETSRQLKPTARASTMNASISPRQAIWVVAELIDGKIRPVTFELLGRSIELAAKINGQVCAIVIGHDARRHAPALAAFGADKVYVADADALEEYSTEAYSAVLAAAIRENDPYAVLIPSTANGRDLAPRVAARLNAGLTGDCIGLEIDDQGRLVQLKPAFGGNIVAPILTRTRPALATVRPGMLQPAEPNAQREPAIVQLNVDRLPASRVRVVKVEKTAAEGVKLDDAPIIVGVGMGVGSAEGAARVKEWAAALGAPVAATRRVVDAGWLPRQLQVGLTGRSISPRLYIAVGTSGKFNHTVGIQRSRIILAINKDPNADIFKHADYGIVGEWAGVLPALTAALCAAKTKSGRGTGRKSP